MRLELQDPSSEFVDFERYVAALQAPMDPRKLRILRTMARTMDWGGLAPTRLAWAMLGSVVDAALVAERAKLAREQRKQRGVQLETTRTGCKIYRVSAWERPTSKRAKRKARP